MAARGTVEGHCGAVFVCVVQGGSGGGPFLYSFTLDEEGRQPVAHAPDALDLAALAVLQEDLVF